VSEISIDQDAEIKTNPCDRLSESVPKEALFYYLVGLLDLKCLVNLGQHVLFIIYQKRENLRHFIVISAADNRNVLFRGGR
jgi:hypothetical protein